MNFQTPEILLKELNSSLRRLRGACTDLGDEDIDKKLLDVMRRLLLAEVLGNTWVVAIGGSQGAGKTTLVTALHDCPNWLQGNEGRGEKMPVLILEKNDLKEPQGYIRRLVLDPLTNRFNLSDIKVEVDEFHRGIYDPNIDDLLPVLQVPKRYFKRENQAWLLLPGYEKQDRENQSWQELMRQAMIAAGGCIVVTDPTRMANSQQLEIVKDMLEKELKHSRPYIVVSKTEQYRDNPEKQAELRTSAQLTFQVEVELAEKNIILTGTDDPEYVKEWMPHLRDAIEDLNFTGQSDRHLQINNLSNIVGKDLTRVLNAIRSKSRLYFNSDSSGTGDGAEVLELVLENFDEAVETLRFEHSKCVNEQANNAYLSARNELNIRLKNDHEGFKNWLSDAFDTSTETKQKMQALVTGAWHENASDFFTKYVNSLSVLTIGKLGKLSEDNSTDERQTRLPSEKLKKLVDLGYMHKSGKPVRFSALNANTVRDIKILLGNSSKEEAQYQDSSKELAANVKLIPAMSLEYSRLLYALPEVSGLSQDFTPINGSLDPNFVTEGVESLRAGVDLGRTAIKSLATVMAVDVISDGDSDILGALFGDAQSADTIEGGTSSPAPMPLSIHPAAVAATAVVAAAYLATVAVTRLRTFEKKASAQAHDMLANIRDHHVAHLCAQFDETMRVVRERVKKEMRDRYRMDEKLMRKDRLAKAFADVESITSDLRNELDSSAAGLQMFIADRDA